MSSKQQHVEDLTSFIEKMVEKMTPPKVIYKKTLEKYEGQEFVPSRTKIYNVAKKIRDALAFNNISNDNKNCNENLESFENHVNPESSSSVQKKSTSPRNKLQQTNSSFHPALPESKSVKDDQLSTPMAKQTDLQNRSLSIRNMSRSLSVADRKAFEEQMRLEKSEPKKRKGEALSNCTKIKKKPNNSSSPLIDKNPIEKNNTNKSIYDFSEEDGKNEVFLPGPRKFRAQSCCISKNIENEAICDDISNEVNKTISPNIRTIQENLDVVKKTISPPDIPTIQVNKDVVKETISPNIPTIQENKHVFKMPFTVNEQKCDNSNESRRFLRPRRNSIYVNTNIENKTQPDNLNISELPCPPHTPSKGKKRSLELEEKPEELPKRKLRLRLRSQSICIDNITEYGTVSEDTRNQIKKNLSPDIPKIQENKDIFKMPSPVIKEKCDRTTKTRFNSSARRNSIFVGTNINNKSETDISEMPPPNTPSKAKKRSEERRYENKLSPEFPVKVDEKNEKLPKPEVGRRLRSQSICIDRIKEYGTVSEDTVNEVGKNMLPDIPKVHENEDIFKMPFLVSELSPPPRTPPKVKKRSVERKIEKKISPQLPVKVKEKNDELPKLNVVGRRLRSQSVCIDRINENKIVSENTTNEVKKNMSHDIPKVHENKDIFKMPVLVSELNPPHTPPKVKKSSVEGKNENEFSPEFPVKVKEKIEKLSKPKVTLRFRSQSICIDRKNEKKTVCADTTNEVKKNMSPDIPKIQENENIFKKYFPVIEEKCDRSTKTRFNLRARRNSICVGTNINNKFETDKLNTSSLVPPQASPQIKKGSIQRKNGNNFNPDLPMKIDLLPNGTKLFSQTFCIDKNKTICKDNTNEVNKSKNMPAPNIPTNLENKDIFKKPFPITDTYVNTNIENKTKTDKLVRPELRPVPCIQKQKNKCIRILQSFTYNKPSSTASTTLLNKSETFRTNACDLSADEKNEKIQNSNAISTARCSSKGMFPNEIDTQINPVVETSSLDEEGNSVSDNKLENSFWKVISFKPPPNDICQNDVEDSFAEETTKNITLGQIISKQLQKSSKPLEPLILRQVTKPITTTSNINTSIQKVSSKCQNSTQNFEQKNQIAQSSSSSKEQPQASLPRFDNSNKEIQKNYQIITSGNSTIISPITLSATSSKPTEKDLLHKSKLKYDTVSSTSLSSKSEVIFNPGSQKNSEKPVRVQIKNLTNDKLISCTSSSSVTDDLRKTNTENTSSSLTDDLRKTNTENTANKVQQVNPNTTTTSKYETEQNRPNIHKTVFRRMSIHSTHPIFKEINSSTGINGELEVNTRDANPSRMSISSKPQLFNAVSQNISDQPVYIKLNHSSKSESMSITVRKEPEQGARPALFLHPSAVKTSNSSSSSVNALTKINNNNSAKKPQQVNLVNNSATLCNSEFRVTNNTGTQGRILRRMSTYCERPVLNETNKKVSLVNKQDISSKANNKVSIMVKKKEIIKTNALCESPTVHVVTSKINEYSNPLTKLKDSNLIVKTPTVINGEIEKRLYLLNTQNNTSDSRVASREIKSIQVPLKLHTSTTEHHKSNLGSQTIKPSMIANKESYLQQFQKQIGYTDANNLLCRKKPSDQSYQKAIDSISNSLLKLKDKKNKNRSATNNPEVQESIKSNRKNYAPSSTESQISEPLAVPQVEKLYATEGAFGYYISSMVISEFLMHDGEPKHLFN